MKKRTSSRILRAAVSLCLVFALFCTMGMMAFAQADDVLGTIREVFPDENLAQVMAVTLNKSVEDIVTRGELEHVGYIDGANWASRALRACNIFRKLPMSIFQAIRLRTFVPLKTSKK